MDQASSVSTLSPLSSSLVMSPTPSFLDLSFSLNSMNSSSTSAVNVSGGSGQLPLSSSCSSLSSSTSTISDYATGISNSLSNEIAVHLMLFNSIEIMSRRFANDQIYYKLTCFDMNSMETTVSSSMPSTPTVSSAPVAMDEESLGIGDEYSCEIAIMNNEEFKFHAQATFGRLLKRNEFVMVRARMPMTENIGVRVDLFKRTVMPAPPPTTAAVDDDDGSYMYEKIAFCYIYPLDVTESSDGLCRMPITSRTGKLVARIKAQYFIARPYAGSEPQQMIKTRLARGNSKAWQLKNGGLDIGHRGAGSARRTDRSEKVLENTVDSFNYAFKKGADMVELDVQISKDKVPVVYHDFNVNIVLQKKDRNIETYPVNIKDLTFDQLQMLRTNPVRHDGDSKPAYEFDEDEGQQPHNQPFASFKSVLNHVEPQCGFNVEIKYPQKKINGQWEAEKSLDLNEYVDLVLQDLCNHAGDRNIIISSFHPELCSLVKLKQDRYPVLFLTQGLTKKWMQYENPLNHSIEMATYLALSTGLYGIAAHTEDILRDRNLIRFVKSKGLILFVWGDDLNDREVIAGLKKEGVDGAIYDKIDLYVSKEDRLPQEGQQQHHEQHEQSVAMDVQ
ncbi:Glycerophosphocholine phosphodiesterase gpcpd1 [Tyrophagus putrescentiae]|nr:Glycerophosphocholine phosphodiesterase gpcpd1 [Tyrophagus putrescentiae]